MDWPLKNFFSQTVAAKLEVPAAEVFVHLFVAVLSVLSIVTIERVLHFTGLDGKSIHGTTITLGDWMFDLEVLAATLIIVVGMAKALVAAWRGP